MRLTNQYFKLCRVRISLFAACSAATGFFAASGRVLTTGVAAFLGVFLLSAGASCLNQWQEQDIDRLMERTKSRPLPSLSISPRQALFVSILLILFGAGILSVIGTVPAMLGLSALLLYNCIYTPLKRKTAFAGLAGAVSGALPPAIGWAAVGKEIFDAQLLVIILLFFIWQMPHSWMLMLRHKDDYEKAGLPSIVSIFGKRGTERITAAWLSAAAALGISMPAWNITSLPISSIALVTVGAWLVLQSRHMFYERSYHTAFRTSYYYILLVMTTVSLDNMAQHYF